MEKIKAFLIRPEPVKWLFYGDSITHGARHTSGGRDYTEHFAERLRAEMPRPQDVVLNTAISGNTTRDLLATFDWRVAQFRPDVVFLMIGMNDCSTTRNIPVEEFRANLHLLADRIEGVGGAVVLQTTCPILPNSAPDREGNFVVFMNAVREVAKARSLPLIDHEAFWRENADKHYYWMNNAFHPNAAGHLAFAFELFRQLGIFDANSEVCRFYLP